YLARVVPWPAENEPGYVNLHWTVPGHNEKQRFWRGRAVRTLEEAEKTLKWALGQSNTLDIYACMSLQRDAKEIVTRSGNELLAAARSQEAALAIKSLFLDIDVGKKDGYATLNEASSALTGLIEKISLPRPSVLVHSGGGLHVYWTFDR